MDLCKRKTKISWCRTFFPKKQESGIQHSLQNASVSSSITFNWSNPASSELRTYTSGPQINQARIQSNHAITRYITLPLSPHHRYRASSLHHIPTQTLVSGVLSLLLLLLIWNFIGKRTFGTYLCLLSWSISSGKQLKNRFPQGWIYNAEELLKTPTVSTAMVKRPLFTLSFSVALLNKSRAWDRGMNNWTLLALTPFRLFL